ncbi:MAG: AbrB/MazE/SpoVT family DNA-binding domain-containing protein [Nanoarchaeota archaeon]|nr:AbrB/MazE/SpoVT family DNA-binding domain-containing protein [Nanoarchaeota archaeon]
MAEIDITRMSSKGQVVIPLEMRKHLKEGDKLLIIKSGEQLILKKANDFDNNLKEDLEFARRTEEAYKRHERGEFIKMDFDEFIKEMKKW